MADTLGDRMKRYERMTESTAMPGLPLLARIDGRAFHTFTKGLERPYCQRLSDLMADVTAALVAEFVAIIGYTQSDEISLLWYQCRPETDLPFGGRIQKLASVLAAAATVIFNRVLPDVLPEKRTCLPMFDARVWSVPTQEEAANYFLWRERDATKNSVSMAAQAVCGHVELQGKHTNDMQELLFQRGINWNDYPAFFKRGQFVRRVAVERPFTAEELKALPPLHHARTKPDAVVVRTVTGVIECEPLSKVPDRVAFIFGGSLTPPVGPPQDVLRGPFNVAIAEIV